MDIEEKTLNALRWIVDILNRREIKYQITGGFAAKLYGSPRPLNDIDIDISEKHLSEIVPEIKDYIIYGPKRYNDDGKWDLELMTLNYKGQEIDISGVENARMSNKIRSEWLSIPVHFSDSLDFTIQGISIKVVHPGDLVEYKKELDGEHQRVDIQATEKYILENGLYGL